jgi:hypothetical protein
MPEQLPDLLGAGAAFLTSTAAPSYGNGVIELDVIHRPTTVGYMYGGILAQQANFGNTTATGAIFKVTLIPTTTTG